MKIFIAIVMLCLSINCHSATKDEHCLAVAIYEEASKTSLQDQRAVYQVIVNRMKASDLSACQVVKAHKQFSFVTSHTKWVATQEMLSTLYTVRAMPKIFSSDILWFHANYVKPVWSKKLKLVYSTGIHKYYRKK